ncbi:MAG TPA: enolase C-terminal domain-like protein, partial [Myxococcales bacterium]|nr:enolase C-terminal domain-like protein [Myxococcales bacterium]
MMTARIENPAIELQPYRLRLAHPVQTSQGRIEHREGYVVLLREGGLVGRGEALGRPEEFPDGTPAARFAMELAQLDLLAQRQRVPLARLLEPRAAAVVPASALLSAGSMADLAREARQACADGYSTVKLKVGTANDFARAAVVRDAVGPGVKLRVDANGAWERDEALWRLQELAPLDVEMCEQPTTDLRGLAGAAVPVAADELCATDPDAALERAQI